MSALKFTVPTLEKVREETEKAFGKVPCLFQSRDCVAQLSGKDVVTISPTGSGKTLTFWMPLIFNNNGITIIITALNILGNQNVKELERLNIKGVNVTGITASPTLFKEMAQCKYRVIVVSPELILNDNRFNTLWENKQFTSRLFSISIDEAHCIKQWGKDFRPDYANLGRLRWLVPSHVRFHLVSATLPDHLLKDVMDKLYMKKANVQIIRRPNDRPNVHIMVEKMQNSPSSVHDLERILRLHLRVKGNGIATKFMIFAKSRKDTEQGAKKMWEELDLPPDLKEKIVWFHSGMSAEFRESTLQKLRDGEIFGLFCTDAAGMGLDLPDIDLVIQWRYTRSLCVLMQRFGRGGRGPGTEATGIYLVESQFFDNAKKQQKNPAKAPKRKSDQKSGARRRKKQRLTETSIPSAQEPALSDSEGEPQRLEHGHGDQEDHNDRMGAAEGGEHEDAEASQDLPDACREGGPEEVGMNGQIVEGCGILVPPNDVVEERMPAQPSRNNLMILTTGQDKIFDKPLLPSPEDLDEDEYEALVMDMFINAQDRGICRRSVIDAYFGNDKCQDEWCCSRCGRKPSRLCCDTCRPEAFLILPLTVKPPKIPRAKRKFNLDDFKMDAHDKELLKALKEWRAAQLKQIGLEHDDVIGAQLIVVDRILERIVGLARKSQITDLDSLAVQTQWVNAKKHGNAILEIVRRFPPPQPATVPSKEKQRPVLQASDAPNLTSNSTLAFVNDGPIAAPSKAVRSCRACGSPDHIASNRNCPQYKDGQKNKDTENIDPGTSQCNAAANGTRRNCSACGGSGHIASSRICPQWKPVAERRKDRQDYRSENMPIDS